MTAGAANRTDERAANWRIRPSIPVAIGVFIAYVVGFIGLSATSGIAYDQWFTSGSNTLRAAVIPLFAGSVVLIVFVLWGAVGRGFRDPARLPMSGFLWVAVALFATGIVVHFLGRAGFGSGRANPSSAEQLNASVGARG